MKHGIRRVPALWRATRLARRWYHARRDAYPDWSRLTPAESSTWEEARRAAQGGRRVLMATSIGSYAHAVTLESALAAALTFRGAEVHALLCDAALTACAECEASFYPDVQAFVASGPSKDLCRDCRWPAERVYEQLGLRVHRFSDWLTDADRDDARAVASGIALADIPAFTRDGVAVGEHAYAGALRFFATGSIEHEPQGEAVLRRYLESALLTTAVTRRLCREVGFESAVFTHGIYVPWGLIGESARREGVRVVTWNVAYRKRRFVFSHDDIEIHAADFRARLLGHLERCDVAGVAGSTQLCGPAWAWAGPPFLYGQVGQYHRAQNLFEAATFAVPARHVGNMQALDGMFIACHRKVVLATPFDEQTFTGFHHYDLDFTYRAFLSGFRLAVCCDLDMIHFSDGTWNDAWKASAARFMQKYAGKLPERPRPPNWNRMSVRVATRQELLPRLRPPHWEFS